MLRSIYSINVETTPDHNIIIDRVFYKPFLKHISTYFGVDSIKQIPMFGVVETRFFNKVFQFKFKEFFAPEIYFIFRSLYDRYKEKDYLEVCNLLASNTWLQSAFDDNIQKPSDIDGRLQSMQSSLLPYQRQYMDKYFESKQKLQLRGALLAYDQGLGKTITSLFLANVLNKEQTVIICPLSLAENWMGEIFKHINPKASVGIVGKHKPAKYKYVICSYERMEKLLSYISSDDFFLVIDESHNLRYLNTIRTKNILAMREKYNVTDILALSGTPIKALATELIPILMLLDPKFNDNETIAMFSKIYGKFRSFAYSILQHRLSIMMERRLKNEVLTLPKKHPPQIIKLRVKNPERYMLKNVKNEVIEYAVKRVNELTQNKKENYKRLQVILSYCVQEQIIDTKEAEYMYKIIVEMTGANFFHMSEKDKERLYQFNLIYNRCQSKLKPIHTDYSKELTRIKAATLGMNMKALGEAMGRIYIPRFQEAVIAMFTSNVNKILDVVNKSIKKTIMFGTSVVALKYIYKYLNGMNVKSILITGDTSDSVTSELERFKKDDSINILLASIQKLSTGVTITEANTCIFIDTPYRDADFRQAQDRIYRIGQDTDVYIFILTIDTGSEPNIITHNKEIMEWSGQITSTLIRR